MIVINDHGNQNMCVWRSWLRLPDEEVLILIVIVEIKKTNI